MTGTRRIDALTFLGAARTVTGSKTLVESDGRQLLVDCGLFQGQRELRRRNWEALPLSLDRVEAVLLTHAHLDHCGYLPRLCADGFTGSAHATGATTELAEVVLLDSAYLLEEEARHALEHAWSKHPAPRPLYDSQDAKRAISRLQATRFGEPVAVAPWAQATLRPAGHILGSATVEIRLGEAGPTVLLSGDLGRSNHPLLVPPAPPPPADVIVVESTYGDRRHAVQDPSRLATVINLTVGRGGSVLIPAFAVDRTEVLLCALRDLMAGGSIPQLPVFLDSPMALTALRIYREAIRRGDADVREPVTHGGDPFDCIDLRPVSTAQESMSLNAPSFPSIIISASGMASGGRVLHHLAHQLPDPRNSVVLVGFQAAGTRGRALQQGARNVKIHGRYVPVRAEICDLEEYSVHADGDELLGWLGQAPQAPTACFVIHGEQGSSLALQERIERELGWTAVVPEPNERVLVD